MASRRSCAISQAGGARRWQGARRRLAALALLATAAPAQPALAVADYVGTYRCWSSAAPPERQH